MATQDLLTSFGAAKIDSLTPDVWNSLLRTIEVRLVAIEAKKVSFDDVVKELQAIGLARINEALLPAFNEIAGLAHLGAIFTAQSATTVTIGTGQRQFTVAALERDRFAPTAYLMARANDDPSAAMLGSLVGYDRPTGTLTIAVDYVTGAGSFNAWTVMPSLAPDLGHETRTDNPHHVTAEQVGAYTKLQVDAALADVGEALEDAGNAISGKLAKSANLSDLTDADAALTNLGATTIGAGLLKAATVAAVRNALELAAVAKSGSYDDLSNKPSIPAAPTDRVTQIRLAFAGDYPGTGSPNTGNIYEPYTGSVITGLNRNTNSEWDLGRVRFRYLQYYTPAAGWVTAAFA